MTNDEMMLKLKEALTPKRYVHSVNVMETAVKLAQKYQINTDKTAVAGLLHDCARDVRGEEIFTYCKKFNISVDNITRVQPELLHGPIGAEIAREEYGIDDVDVLKAIYVHTLGCAGMSMLQKVVFIADFIEPGRCFPGVEEIRKTAFADIDRAIIMALDSTIRFVITKGALFHPDAIYTRNFLLRQE